MNVIYFPVTSKLFALNIQLIIVLVDITETIVTFGMLTLCFFESYSSDMRTSLRTA